VDFKNKDSFELISLLCKSTESNIEESLRISSLIALSYIIQEIKISEISAEYINECIKSFYSILTREVSVKLILEAIICLYHFLPFMKSIIINEVNINKK